MKLTKKKKIIMPPDFPAKNLADIFKVSRTTIFRALKYDVSSTLSSRIREEAIKNGGKVTECPQWE